SYRSRGVAPGLRAGGGGRHAGAVVGGAREGFPLCPAAGAVCSGPLPLAAYPREGPGVLGCGRCGLSPARGGPLVGSAALPRQDLGRQAGPESLQAFLRGGNLSHWDEAEARRASAWEKWV